MMTTQMRDIRSFTQDPDMWHGFAGCECWPNGSEPVFCEIGTWLIVIDPNGCGVYGGDDSYEKEYQKMYGGMAINQKFPTQKSAIAFLRGLPDDFVPADYGAVDC